MFTGRPHRAVNLGSKKTASTRDALRNAEFQRQKREKIRQETNAATRLQNVWRSRRDLQSARHALAEEAAQHPELVNEPNVFAYILPDFPQWPAETREAWTSRFLDSPQSGIPSEMLLKRLPLLWELASDSELHTKLGLRVLDRQAPHTIPLALMLPLLQSVLHSYRDTDFQWLATRYPDTVFSALLMQPNVEVLLKEIPDALLVPLYTVHLHEDELKGKEKSVSELLQKVLPDSARSWPLIFQLVEYLPNIGGMIRDHLNLFYNRSILVPSMALKPLDLARYTQTLLHVAPAAKPRILLQMVTQAGTNVLQQYWKLYKELQSELALRMTVDLLSYWLLVATDYEVLDRHSLPLDDLLELAVVVKQHSFHILWADSRRKMATSSETAVLRLLRQLYNRDSRMKLFPADFWLVDKNAGQRFVHIFDSYLQGSRPKVPSFNLATNDVQDEDDEDAELGEPADLLRFDENPAKRVLDFAPFFIPFETRVMLFSRFVLQDREKLGGFGQMFGRQHFDINRETIVEDSQHVFASLGSNVKTEMAVRLLSDGVAEAGIDGGGLTRELLIALCEKLFHEELTTADKPLFVETPEHTLLPNPVFGETPQLMTPAIRAKYLFMGQVVGKCLYENLLVDVEFSPLFLSKWKDGATVRSGLDDLGLLDEELHANLTKLHSIYGKDVEALGLDFTTANSQHKLVELRPHGAQTTVTDMNKVEYMRELANYKLNVVFKPQTSWFLLGLSQIIRREWLSLFNPSELNKLISGESLGVDVGDLQRHTVVNGFSPRSPTIANLWSVLQEFSLDERAQFLKFVTSVPKPPLLGFARLEPGFGIRCVGDDDQRLPTASTCLNLLKLPEYSSKEILRKKLLYAIRSKAGFELS